jgi:hypothetical protein
MEKKTVDINQYRVEKGEKLLNAYLEAFLINKGLDVTEENLEIARYEFDFSDELKEELNEYHVEKFYDAGLITHKIGMKKLTLTFNAGKGDGSTKTLVVWVDVNGNLQLDSQPY